MLYSGLSNAGQQSGSATNPATDKATSLMNTIQAGVTAAQQYASIEQSIIGDIQNSQQNVATLADCWSTVASSTTATPAQVAQGNTGFSSAVSTVTQLQGQVIQSNAKITAANASIARLQELQTGLLLATVSSDVDQVQSQLSALQNAGNPRIYTSTDITSAQQDRTSQQSQLASTDQTTSTQLAQCYAIGQ